MPSDLSPLELHGNAVTVEVVKLLKRFDEQEIDRKPDGAAPIGISTEEASARFCRFVVHAMFVAVTFIA